LQRNTDDQASDTLLAATMKRDSLPSLLLLPFPPDPASRVCLNAAYRPSLTAGLRRLRDADAARTLVVALACPILSGPYMRSKTLPWPHAQSLLAGLYSIIAVICAELSIETDVNGGPGSVDARVLLIDHDRARRFAADFRPAVEPNNTAIVDLPTFASAYFPWNYIFHVDSEQGHQLYSMYLKFAEGTQTLLQEQLVTVQAGVTMNATEGGIPTAHPQTASHQTVCLGGTFDHLHPGHKLLLTAGAYILDIPKEATSDPCHYIIGITGDELLKNKKYAELVQPWDERARNVLQFLSTVLELSPAGWKQGRTLRIDESDGDFRAFFRDRTVSVQCVRIHDAFGPTITEENIDALVVSGETRSGGQAVNDKRVAQGWKPLEIFEVDVLEAGEISDEATKTENFASKISSTAIRQLKAEAATS
jgi:phosphopantetheine adenylyltransferase